MNNFNLFNKKRAAQSCSFFFAFFFILIFLSSCLSDPGENAIITGPAYYFEAKAGYKEADLNQPGITRAFGQYLYIDSSDLVLNKILFKGTDTLYLSLSLANGPAVIAKKLLADSSYTILQQQKKWLNEQSVTTLHCLNKQKHLIRIFLPDKESKSLLVIDKLEADSASAVNFYQKGSQDLLKEIKHL